MAFWINRYLNINAALSFPELKFLYQGCQMSLDKLDIVCLVPVFLLFWKCYTYITKILIFDRFFVQKSYYCWFTEKYKFRQIGVFLLVFMKVFYLILLFDIEITLENNFIYQSKSLNIICRSKQKWTNVSRTKRKWEMQLMLIKSVEFQLSQHIFSLKLNSIHVYSFVRRLFCLLLLLLLLKHMK